MIQWSTKSREQVQQRKSGNKFNKVNPASVPSCFFTSLSISSSISSFLGTSIVDNLFQTDISNENTLKIANLERNKLTLSKEFSIQWMEEWSKKNWSQNKSEGTWHKSGGQQPCLGTWLQPQPFLERNATAGWLAQWWRPSFCQTPLQQPCSWSKAPTFHFLASWPLWPKPVRVACSQGSFLAAKVEASPSISAPVWGKLHRVIWL